MMVALLPILSLTCSGSAKISTFLEQSSHLFWLENTENLPLFLKHETTLFRIIPNISMAPLSTRKIYVISLTFPFFVHCASPVRCPLSSVRNPGWVLCKSLGRGVLLGH